MKSPQIKIDNNNNIKKRCLKKKRNNRKSKNSNIGKPVGLGEIILEQPKIWTCFEQEMKLITLLHNEGRHVCLHLAGTHITKKNKKNNQKNGHQQDKLKKIQQISSEKPIYEYLTFIAKQFFDKTDCKKKNIVYFFGHNYSKRNENQIDELTNPRWRQILKNIHFLLEDKFFEELLLILKKFENNQTTNQIVDDMLQKTFSTQHYYAPQIIQNFFIQQFENKSLGINNKSKDSLYKLFIDQLETKQFIINEFVDQIRQIFENSQDNSDQIIGDQDIEDEEQNEYFSNDSDLSDKQINTSNFLYFSD